MNFDVDRLSKLAGLRRGSSNGSGALNEASNRALHDDPSLADEAEHRFGKGQLAEGEHSTDEGEHSTEEGHGHSDDEMDEAMTVDDMEIDLSEDMHGEDPMEEVDYSEMHHAMEEDSLDPLDEVLEIDENILKQEIKKMQQERIVESNMRNVIRKEIQEILEGAGVTSDSSWIYGDDQPKNSGEGQVSMGFDFGFKK